MNQVLYKSTWDKVNHSDKIIGEFLLKFIGIDVKSTKKETLNQKLVIRKTK